MEIINFFIDFILHVDTRLGSIIAEHGAYVYPILFTIIFCETGLVVTPFLPGDSLLFAAGSFAALGSMDLFTLMLLLTAAAICGDNTNYWIGRKIGPGIFRSEKNILFRRDYLDKTQRYYGIHGGKTVLFARFMPIFRTFVPFVAGVGRMEYSRFLPYSVSGSILWVNGFVLAGYFFGSLPFVRQRFTLVIFGIILISMFPMLLHGFRTFRARLRKKALENE
ncbi:DedA family protein [bacterium]|nr:MAG: DedA family protein [bacterium]